MKLCRVIFRKTTGEMLVRSVYSNDNKLPTPDQEINDFASLNGYNIDALTIIDIPENNPEFENVSTAETIKLENGTPVFTFAPKEPDLPIESNPISELGNKLDLIIQMQLEREGII